MNNIINAVDKYRDLILEAERYIWRHPETGYKEFETSKYMEEKFRELGYELTFDTCAHSADEMLRVRARINEMIKAAIKNV